MALFKAKQVKKFIAGKLFLGAIPVTFVGGSPSLFTSVSIATKLTTALTAAAADGSNLPDQSDTFVSGLTTKRREGLPYTAPSNLVEVYNAFYQKMKDTVGNEVYGRLVQGVSSAEEIASQDANSDLLYIKIAMNPASYLDKAALMADIVDFQTTYDNEHPVLGRTSLETAYAAEISSIVAHASILNVDSGTTLLAMHTAVIARATARSPYIEERVSAAIDMKTRLGTDLAAYTLKTEVSHYLSLAIQDYETLHPDGTRTPSHRAYMNELTRVHGLSLAYVSDPVETVLTSHTKILAELDSVILHADGDYKVQFYVNSVGAETVFAFAAPVTYSINLVLPYLYTFEHLPYDFATGLKSLYVNDDPTGAVEDSTVKVELVSITDENTFDPLEYVYVGSTASTLYVNGQTIISLTGLYTISTVTNKIVWDDVEAGYNLSPEDIVFIEYKSTGVLHV